MEKNTFIEKARKIHGDTYDYSMLPDEFKVKVTADLDTSQLEAKLNALQNKKINVQINLSNLNGSGMNNLNNSLQQIQNNANNVSASLKGIATTKLKVDAFNFLKTQTENAVQSVTDLNKAMTLVNMTMSNMSGSSLNSLKQQLNDNNT